MKIAELEKRVIELEKKIAAITGPPEPMKPADPNAWLDQIRGTFENNAANRAAARYGREWRRSQGIDGKKPRRRSKAS